MTTTPIGAAPLIAEAQAGAHEPFNELILRAPVHTHLIIQSATTAAQPGAPADGDVYFLPPAATGTAWAGNDGKIALRLGGAWEFYDPADGMQATILDERRAVWWCATLARWMLAGLRLVVEDVTLSGASTDTAGDFIRDGWRRLAVESVVLTEVAGVTGYSIGPAAALTDHGDGLTGLTVGSSYHGAINGVAHYADAAIRVTAVGGTFSGGVLRLIGKFTDI